MKSTSYNLMMTLGSGTNPEILEKRGIQKIVGFLLFISANFCHFFFQNSTNCTNLREVQPLKTLVSDIVAFIEFYLFIYLFCIPSERVDERFILRVEKQLYIRIHVSTINNITIKLVPMMSLNRDKR